MTEKRRATMLGMLTCLAVSLAGCGGGVDTSYGRAHNTSINGTGAFAELLREQGHEVRIAVAMTDELRDWAEVIIRFAPFPGSVRSDEAHWYSVWMDETIGARLLYIPRDFDASTEYWRRVLADLPPDAPPRLSERIREALDAAEKVSPHVALPPGHVAPADEWFAVKPTSNPGVVCTKLSGPWAAGVDAAKAALPRKDTLKLDSETVLLKGDDQPLVIAWTRADGGRVLVAANAAFLLNATLGEPARRPLALRAASWVGSDGGDDANPKSERTKRVAILEGSLLAGPRMATPSVFSLLEIRPFNWVAAQLLVLGLAACLARAPRLGRARPDTPSGAEKPVAHPEALGALLARTRQAGDARALLETYRRWRFGATSRGETVRTLR